MDVFAKELKECLGTARILRHFLNDVENVTLNWFEDSNGSIVFRCFGLLIFSSRNLDNGLVVTHLDGRIILAFLYRHLLLWLIVDTMCYCLGIDREGYGHDGDKCQ